MADEQTVNNDRLYQEAMLTFRAVMTASVSTATALFAGSLAAVGFAVDDAPDIDGGLLLVAAAPLVAMSVTFIGWWTFNLEASAAAADALGKKHPNLHTDLGNRPGPLLIITPLLGAALLLYWGLWIMGSDDTEFFLPRPWIPVVVVGVLILGLGAVLGHRSHRNSGSTPQEKIRELTAENRKLKEKNHVLNEQIQKIKT